jgi:hypothetical protein
MTGLGQRQRARRARASEWAPAAYADSPRKPASDPALHGPLEPSPRRKFAPLRGLCGDFDLLAVWSWLCRLLSLVPGGPLHCGRDQAEDGIRFGFVAGAVEHDPVAGGKPGQGDGMDFGPARGDRGLAGCWVLDPRASRVEFGVRHFWGAVTVRGWFERLEGEGSWDQTGRSAGSWSWTPRRWTPRTSSATGRAELTHGAQLAAEGELEAAGVREPLSFTAEVVDGSADAVTLKAGLTVDRSRFGMTWSPLRMTSM